jgi:hypothetical protein
MPVPSQGHYGFPGDLLIQVFKRGSKHNQRLETIAKRFIFRTGKHGLTCLIVTEYGTALTTILPILFLYLNTVIVTTGTFEP